MKKSLPKILLIFAGGTIAMARKLNGSLAPARSIEELLALIPYINSISELDYEFVVNIDSTNMQPAIWTKIAEVIYRNYAKYDGFVITHGTDTMAFTASALSFAFRNLSKPIILTGSQKPPEDIASDAQNNLLNAIKVASMKIPEVCIVFASNIFRGNRASKKSEVKLKAFWSPVAPPLGQITLEPELFLQNIYSSKGKLIFRPNYENDVMVYNLFPGLQAKYIENTINNGVKGLILNSYGPGNVPNQDYSLLPIIKKAVKQKIPVIITTQCVEGSVRMFLYEVGYAALKAGAISALDMTFEAAVTKLMWILAQTNDLAKIKKLMQTNLAGEVSVE